MLKTALLKTVVVGDRVTHDCGVLAPFVKRQGRFPGKQQPAVIQEFARTRKWLAKIDLSKVFHRTPVDESQQKYYCFQLEHEYLLHVEDSKRKQDQLTAGLEACQLDIEDLSSHYFTDLWQAVFRKQQDTCALGGKPIENCQPFPLSDEWMARRIKFLIERSQMKTPETMKREARDCRRMAKELVNPPWRILSKGMARMRALHIEKANEVLKAHMSDPIILAMMI
eukprot:Blabericola_migrator_1__2961@NODE_1856_length_3655_cov_6_386009_g1187_i0_p1_GENE_NODE_1856_length_3655_cov_6_386009_g1187_i0NODE_1856_length_3655_cov_6_386009_g1187_i0_p1_ORF_typecomplete_len225_score28_40DUF3658/PF12395_8/0_013P22_AR_N/PF10547_9/1_2e02P22_AR_N/PF10547_9/0_089DUF4298/PF14131_6/0_12PH/PF00169_29/0_21RVT_1/PF00078_27/0_18_NODE_1856_length_3655_cov_6_386009_g1187_i019432617